MKFSPLVLFELFCVLHNVNARLWYAYSANKVFDESCGSNTTHIPDKVTPEQVQKYNLWQVKQSKDDWTYGESMTGFLEGMDALWKHQNPEDCSKAKFMIAGDWEEGFGSEVHVIGAGMAAAIAMGRVYVIGNRNKSNTYWQVDTEHCRAQGNTINHECYFEPWTHCTEKEIYGDTKSSDLVKLVTENYQTDEYTPELFAEHRVILSRVSSGTKRFVPTDAFNHIVQCHTLLKTDHGYYWWRVMATAYQLRPNKATTELLVQHRKDPTMQFDVEKETCVAMYVRRGDKHQEMEPVPLESYFEAAKTAWTNLENDAKITNQTLSGPPVLFVGSEDQTVIDNAKDWGTANSWSIRYTNLFSRDNQAAALNYTMQTTIKRNPTKYRHMHHDLEYFSMLLNLDSFLHCRAFICTQNSNFCRIIDELRASVGRKSNRELIEMEVFSGRHRPGTITLGW